MIDISPARSICLLLAGEMLLLLNYIALLLKSPQLDFDIMNSTNISSAGKQLLDPVQFDIMSTINISSSRSKFQIQPNLISPPFFTFPLPEMFFCARRGDAKDVNNVKWSGEPSWSELCCYSATEFGKCCSGTDGSIKERIFFPVPLETVVNGQEELHTSYNSTLPLLGADTCVLGWCLAMHDAMQASDTQWIQLLWECGRSVTLRFWNAGGMTPVASLSIQYSEKLAKHSELANTFLTFGDKVKACLDHETQIRFILKPKPQSRNKS